MKPKFTWSDAWVLAAVALGGGDKGAGLKEIIEAGDLINRALLSPAQLRCGLGKLVHEGHVHASAGSYGVQGDALLEARRVAYTNPTSYDLLQHFEDFLEATPYDGTPGADADSPWALEEVTEENVAAAREAYRREYAALHREANDQKGG